MERVTEPSSSWPSLCQLCRCQAVSGKSSSSGGTVGGSAGRGSNVRGQIWRLMIRRAPRRSWIPRATRSVRTAEAYPPIRRESSDQSRKGLTLGEIGDERDSSVSIGGVLARASCLIFGPRLLVVVVVVVVSVRRLDG